MSDAIQKRPTTQLSRRGFISTLGKVALVGSAAALGVTAEVAHNLGATLEEKALKFGDLDDKMPLLLATALHLTRATKWLKGVEISAQEGRAAVDKILKDGTY